MKRNLLEIINEVLSGNKRDKVTNINDNDNLRYDLGFDSLMLAELTVEIESEYGIDIFDDGLITKVSEINIKINE
jgi:acyl carrier protein